MVSHWKSALIQRCLQKSRWAIESVVVVVVVVVLLGAAATALEKGGVENTILVGFCTAVVVPVGVDVGGSCVAAARVGRRGVVRVWGGSRDQVLASRYPHCPWVVAGAQRNGEAHHRQQEKDRVQI